MTLPHLQSVLLELLNELAESKLPLIIGGGFGIYLRRRQVAESGEQTLLRILPEARSTHDIDLFLRPELFANSKHLFPLKEALERLHFQPMASAKFYQFIRAGDVNRFEVKIDLLTGASRDFKTLHVKVDNRRVHPRPPIALHAHPCKEAFTLMQGITTCQLLGELPDGTITSGKVFLPHAYTFLCMKLCALFDQIDNIEKDCGRHHALDLYTVVGTITLAEWDQCLDFKRRYKSDDIAKQCAGIVARYFLTSEALGVIRLRENHYFRDDFQLPEFLDAMREIFT